MSKHTPGPWESERVYLTIEDPTMRITARDGAVYVAEAAYSHIRGEQAIHVTDADEMRANARLIAAAPELLEALQTMHNVLKEAMTTGGWVPTPVQASFRDAWFDVTAAISKATGEQ